MRHWQIIAHESELRDAGSYVCLPWRVDGEVAAMRNPDGSLTVFDNRCPHRGARIFTTLRGNRPPVCGYHGRCAKPSEVRAFEHQIVNGWVFALDAHLDHYVALDAAWLEHLPATAVLAQCHSTLEMEYVCHWTVAVENALDREHISTVHPETLASLGLRSTTVRKYADGSSFERFAASVDRLDRLDRLCEIFPDSTDIDYFHLHVFPHTALSSTRGATYSLQHYFPRADGKTNFISRLYASTASNLTAGLVFAEAASKFNAQVFAEDARICANVPPFHRGRLQPNEQRIAHFREFIL